MATGIVAVPAFVETEKVRQFFGIIWYAYAAIVLVTFYWEIGRIKTVCIKTDVREVHLYI